MLLGGCSGSSRQMYGASTGQARAEMRGACFDYSIIGGVLFKEGPLLCSLVSLLLYMHFWALVGSISFSKTIVDWSRIDFGCIFPIIKGEGFRRMFFPTTIPAYGRAPPVE